MSDDFLQITCPECKTILIVRRRDGKIVETRRPLLEESTGDRFEDAMEKVRQSKTEVEKKVEAARERERQKMDRLNQLFKEGMQEAQKTPPKKPEREMDLD